MRVRSNDNNSSCTFAPFKSIPLMHNLGLVQIYPPLAYRLVHECVDTAIHINLIVALVLVRVDSSSNNMDLEEISVRFTAAQSGVCRVSPFGSPLGHKPVHT